jgi:hypothetical protein
MGLETENRRTVGTGTALACLGLLLFVLSALIPSKHAIYMMAAASYGQSVAADPKVQALENKVYKILDEKLICY